MRRREREKFAAIFVGGAAGTLLRVWLAVTLPSAAAGWPWTILAVNLSGSLVLGWLAALPARGASEGIWRGPLLSSGFCGAFTTFSTMQIELLEMIEHGRLALAAGYALASVAGGLSAVWAGTALARRGRVIA